MKMLKYSAATVALMGCSLPVFLKETEIEKIQSNAQTVYYLFVGDIAIEGKKGSYQAQGSCVAVECKKINDTYKVYFLTAEHSIAMCTEGTSNYILHNTSNRHRSYNNNKTDTFSSTKFSVEYSNKIKDVAIISAWFTKPIKVSSITSKVVDPYIDIYTLSFPLGEGLMYTDGKVSYFNPNSTTLVTDAQICQGSSGGAVFKRETHELLGIISELSALGNNVIHHMHGFVPLSKTPEVLKWLKENT